MKRLITLIGAVAMSFGLFAEDATPADYYGNSFETAQEGVSGDTWELPTLWSTTLEDAFKVGAYEGGELTGIYKTGAQRRDGSDEQDPKLPTINAKFLKLETGTNTLDCATDGLDMSQGKFYFDQLVKFTGFEEEPTFAADTKIAVWMSAIETEGTPQIGTPQIGTPAQGVEGAADYVPASPDYQPASEDYQPASDDYIAGETNLYVQVGNGTASQKVQLKGAYAVDKWYRITIKSIGDVVAGAGVAVEQQLGFLVFVNGEQAEIVDADKNYYKYATAFEGKPTAKYYEKGQLFTAMTTDMSLSKVGYQGIGAIDDVVLSASSPDFDMSDEIEIEIGSFALNGAKVIKIGDVTITDQTSIKVKPGDILVNYAANGPYIVRNGEGVKWTVNPDGTVVMVEGATIQIIEAAAKITRGGVATYYAADELDATIALVQDGDIIDFLKDCTALEGAYVFAEGTRVTVTAKGNWAVEVPADKSITDLIGTLPEKNITITFATPESELSTFYLAGNIYGNGDSLTKITANGYTWLNNNLTIGATYPGIEGGQSAELKADYIGGIVGGGDLAGDYTITLIGSAKVITLSKLTANSFGLASASDLKVEFDEGTGYYTYSLNAAEQAFEPSATVANDLATAIDYLKNNYYNKYTNGQKIDAPDASYVKVGTLASDVTGTVSIGGTVADAGEKFSLSIGNNAFLESAKFKIVGREVCVAAVILAIEQVKVTANATDYPIESANSGNLELKSFAAVAPTTIAGEGTNFTIVRGDDKPLVKFFFTDTVTQYFVTKKTFIDKNDVATTSYGFTTPDEGGLWLYLGYGVGLGGNWDGVTYNYTVYAFGTDKKAITLSMSITDKAIQPPTPTYTVTFSTNTVAVAEKTLTDVESGTKLAANQIPYFGEGTWDVQPLGAIITSNTNFNFTVKVDPIPPLPAEPTADDVNAKVDAAKFADSTVKTMIGGDPTKYNAFKTWAGTVTGGEAAVVASAHAADSYLLGQTTLLENAPVSEIKTIAKTSDTALTLTFEIKDGANAVTVAQTAADYVKGLVQCNEKVDFGNGTKIDATVTVTINGQTLTAAVTLPANKPAAFMKVAK